MAFIPEEAAIARADAINIGESVVVPAKLIREECAGWNEILLHCGSVERQAIQLAIAIDSDMYDAVPAARDIARRANAPPLLRRKMQNGAFHVEVGRMAATYAFSRFMRSIFPQLSDEPRRAYVDDGYDLIDDRSSALIAPRDFLDKLISEEHAALRIGEWWFQDETSHTHVKATYRPTPSRSCIKKISEEDGCSPEDALRRFSSLGYVALRPYASAAWLKGHLG